MKVRIEYKVKMAKEEFCKHREELIKELDEQIKNTFTKVLQAHIFQDDAGQLTDMKLNHH